MADIAKKTVSIYIDQASAELALEKLQQKADGFTKKAEEARKRQQQLNDEIRKAEAAAAGLDTLRNQYADLEKGIARTSRALDVTTASQKKLSAENKSLSATLEAATTKAAQLQAQIEKARTAGDATKRLENSYETLSRSIEETTEKLRLNELASEAAKNRSEALTAQLQQQKAGAAALNQEVRQSASAAGSVTRLTNEYNKLDKQLNINEQALEKNLAAQKHIQTQIDSGLRPSFNQLTTLVQKLEKELKNLSEDAPGYASKFASFKAASAELEALRTRISGVKKESNSLLSEFKGVAFGVAAGGLVQGAIESIPQLITGRITSSARLSDELADIEKATGLTAQQVESLNSALGKLDTRTKTSELRQIAIGLGQINQQATPENIAAIDKIVVALGDEFGGGANEITKQLSVLRNNLQDLKTDNYAEDIEHIGNALNVLGAEGLATAPVVTDIANRIAGVAQQFKLSSGEILGFAATFQELGIETERGSTAIVQIFQKMAAEPEKFARVAGLSVQEFTNLVNKDMNAAFVKVAKGVQQAGKENVTFSKILKDLNADGSGAGEILSKLAQNSVLLANKQKTVSQALKETTSTTEEFNKKNTTLGAELDKLSKRFSAFFSSSTLNNFLKGAVAGLSNLFEKTKDLNTQFKEQKTVVDALEKDVLPLIVRYDQLKLKATELGGESKLSKVEQQELNKAITTIASNIPTAITKFDQYGNAIEISTQKARAFIEQQKLMLKALNREAINDFENQNKKLERDADALLRQLNKGTTSESFSGGSTMGSTVSVIRNLTGEEIKALQEALKQKRELIAENNAAIASLRGDTLESQLKPQSKPTENEVSNYSTAEDLKKQEALRKKQQADAEKLRKQQEKDEADRLKRLRERLEFENDYYGRLRILYDERLRQFPELASKLDEFLDTEYNSQLQKIKAFYEEKRRLFLNDAEAQKQLQQAEEAEIRALNNNQVIRSVGNSTSSTLSRLKDESIRDQVAKFELELESKHGKEKLALQIGQLEAQRDAALRNAHLTANEKLLIEKQTEKQISEMKLEFEAARLQMVLDFAQQAAATIESINQVQTNNENAALNRELKANDQKRKSYEALLKSKAITQQEYNRRIAELDAQEEARQEAIRKKQFERNKRMQIIQAVMGLAQSIVSTLAARPGAVDIISLGAFRAIQIGLATAAATAQIAAITSQKYAKGGYLDGSSHAEGGIAMIDRQTGREVGEAEGDEVILSKKTVRNNWDVVSPLLSSSMYADGARVNFPWKNRSYRQINYSAASQAVKTVRKYETGGFIDAGASGANAASTAAQQESNAISFAMMNALDLLTKQLATPVRNYVVLQDINRGNARLNQIDNDVTVRRS